MSRPVGLALQSGSDDSVRGFQILVLIEETRDYSVDSKRRQDYSPRAEPHASGTQEGVGQPLLTAVVVQECHRDGGCRQAHDASRPPLSTPDTIAICFLGERCAVLQAASYLVDPAVIGRSHV